MDAAAEVGIQPEYGNEHADAGRDCRTRRLARSNSQGANRDREILIFPVQLTTNRIGNFTRLILTLVLYVMIIHAYHLRSPAWCKRQTRGGTVEPVSREAKHNFSGANRGQEKNNFPCSADHGQNWLQY